MLQHHFPIMASETEKATLVNKVNKISTWMSRAEKLADDNKEIFDRDKFIGDAFEHLCEAILVWNRGDKALNIVDVHPAPYDEEGVDLLGIAHDLKSVHTVQCKYRGNTTTDLTEGRDHIAMFPSVSTLKYDAKYMTILTTANDLHRILDEAWQGKVRTIGFNEIKRLVDKNDAFWQFYSDDLLARN
jgi:hypothetical protein